MGWRHSLWAAISGYQIYSSLFIDEGVFDRDLNRYGCQVLAQRWFNCLPVFWSTTSRCSCCASTGSLAHISSFFWCSHQDSNLFTPLSRQVTSFRERKWWQGIAAAVGLLGAFKCFKGWHQLCLRTVWVLLTSISAWPHVFCLIEEAEMNSMRGGSHFLLT